MILIFPPLAKSYVPAHIRKLADGRVVLVSAHHRTGDRKDTATRGLFDDHPRRRDTGEARRRQAKPKPVPVVFRGTPKRADAASSPSAHEQLTLPFGSGHNARTDPTDARSAGDTGRPKMDEHDGFTAGQHGPAALSLGDKGRLVLTIPPDAVTTALQRKLTAAGFTEQPGFEWWQTKPKGKVEGQGFQRLPRTDEQKAKIQQALDFLADPKKAAKAADKDKVQPGKHGLLTVSKRPDQAGFRLTHDQRFDDKTHAAIKRLGGKWREGAWDVPNELEAKLAGFLRRHHKAHADEAAALAAARKAEAEKTAAAVEQSDLQPGTYGVARVRIGTRGNGQKGYVVDFPYDPDLVSAVKQGTDAKFQPKQKNWFVPGGHEDALREFLDKATAEGERREEAKEKAKEQMARVKREEAVKREQERASEPPKQRRLFPLRAMPPEGVPVRLGKKVVVYTGSGKPFTIDEDAPSMGNPHLLGHEGERGAYAYYRDATPEEVEQLEHREAYQGVRREVSEKVRKLADQVRSTGTRPDPAEGQQAVQGETLLDTQTIHGGGDWWVIQPDKIWYVRNNGADGDNWSANNVRTGGAGAIGWYVPYSDDLARELRGADKAANLDLDIATKVQRKQAGTAGDAADASREAQETLAAKQRELAEAKAAADAKKAEARAEQQRAEKQLRQYVDLDAVLDAQRVMSRYARQVGAQAKGKYHEAQAVASAARKQLASAGLISPGISALALANFNRPDRDHPDNVTMKDILALRQKEED